MFIEIDIRDVVRLPAPCIVPDNLPSVHMALQEKFVAIVQLCRLS